MNIEIKKLILENFKGSGKQRTYDLGNITKIFGPNASGKTTIADAFWWLLFDKDSLGNSKFNIRPLDKEGNRIDNVEIVVLAVLGIDGREIEFKKTQKQKWVKKRGSAVAELQGNENLYEIDGYPKSEKDYKERVSEIMEEELFKMLTNPTYFPGMKWKEQREILMRFAVGISDEALAKSNPEFAELLLEIQKAPSLEDIQKKHQKHLLEWKKKQAELPVRIDEAERQKVELDLSMLELSKKSLVSKIEENQEKQKDISKQFDEYQKLSNGVLEIRFALADLERTANEENDKKKMELNNAKYKLESKRYSLQSGIKNSEYKISASEKQLESCKADLKKIQTEYKETSSMKFDNSELICPMCKQSYPEEKQNEMMADFEVVRKKKLEVITAKGNELSVVIRETKQDIESEKELLEKNICALQEVETEIEQIVKEYSELPTFIDISDTEKHKELSRKLEEKEKMMLQANSSNGIREELQREESSLREELQGIERQLAKTELNVQLDERITELQQEQREVAQKVADQEKMIYLLENFIRYKMDKISEIINSKFEGIRFKLFENQINGGLKETCECTVDGVPYSSLNNGHRIIAGLKIIKALQKLYGVYAPIFVDNAEAISDGNMPDMDNQIIMLVVSSDKNMRIEVQ